MFSNFHLLLPIIQLGEWGQYRTRTETRNPKDENSLGFLVILGLLISKHRVLWMHQLIG